MNALPRRRFLNALAAGAAAGAGSGWMWAAHLANARLIPGADGALIVVDVQNCFVTGGTLLVKDGEQVAPIINKLAPLFQNIVATQDWHTAGHASFASSCGGKKPFESVALKYGQQVLWPDHCVQGTKDAALQKDLKLTTSQLVIRKGFNKGVDSYSAFIEVDGKTTTGLVGYLKARHPHCLRQRPGHGLLRRLDGAGRAQGWLQGLHDRGRLPRHRPQRLAGCCLEGDGEGRLQANPVERCRVTA